MMVFAGDLWVNNEKKSFIQVGHDDPYNFGIL